MNNQKLIKKSKILFNEILLTHPKAKVVKAAGIIDPNNAMFCSHQGLAQGINNSDCFIDSIIFALFSSNITTDFLLKKLILFSKNNDIKGNISYLIILYACLIYDIFKTTNIKGKSFKESVKWCLLWNMCIYIKSFKKKIGIDDEFFTNLITNNLLVNIDEEKMDFGAGDVFNIMIILTFIYPNLIYIHDDLMKKEKRVSKKKDSITSKDIIITPQIINIVRLESVEMRNHVIFLLKEHLKEHLKKKIDTKKSNGLLSAVITTSTKHATAVVYCNEKWLEYNNLLKPTTKVHKSSAIVNKMIKSSTSRGFLVFF
jgi:hypothetical protein